MCAQRKGEDAMIRTGTLTPMLEMWSREMIQRVEIHNLQGQPVGLASLRKEVFLSVMRRQDSQ